MKKCRLHLASKMCLLSAYNPLFSHHVVFYLTNVNVNTLLTLFYGFYNSCEESMSFGEVSSSSGCLGWATLFYCGTP